MYIHVLFVSIFSLYPPHTPTSITPPTTCTHAHIMTYFKKNALPSQRTSQQFMLLCPWESEMYHKNTFQVFCLFFLGLNLKFRISLQKCPGLENHKWIDIYPLFLELGKGMPNYLEEFRFCPNPTSFSPDTNSVKEKDSLWEKSAEKESSPPTLVSNGAPPGRYCLLLLQPILCYSRLRGYLWMDEPWHHNEHLHHPLSYRCRFVSREDFNWKVFYIVICDASSMPTVLDGYFFFCGYYWIRQHKAINMVKQGLKIGIDTNGGSGRKTLPT